MFLFKKKSLYDIFLDSIDDLSSTRIRSIDITLNIYKDKFSYDGFVLTEIDCKNKNIIINRNELGFYVSEINSLNSYSEYDYYLYGLEYLNKHKDEFNMLHKLLCEKELILSGYYNIKKHNKTYLNNIARKLGYMEIRKNILYEENPKHPSDEYNNIIKLLKVNNKTNLRKRIDEVINIIKPYFKDNIKIVPKMVNEKYDLSFDESYGVAIIDENLGDMRMLYEVTGLDIIKSDATPYLKESCPYLDIYFKIIAKCILLIYQKSGK